MSVGHQLPAEARALLGELAVELRGAGRCRVWRGADAVAKVGPSEVVQRETWVLRAAGFPVEVPRLLGHGEGWLVTELVPDQGESWSEAELDRVLADLARLHGEFENGLSASDRSLLGQPFESKGAETILARSRASAEPLPAELGALLARPDPLLDLLGGDPITLLHGDPWPANLRRPGSGRLVWVDWEDASIGPAAADLASWLDQASWHLGRALSASDQARSYLRARGGGREPSPVELSSLSRSVDAASVLWFLAFDVANLSRVAGPRAASMVADCLARARRLGLAGP